MNGTDDIPEDDSERIGGFIRHYFQEFLRLPDGPLYHYTTAENLLKIVDTNEMWATQGACLNDATELIYAVTELSKRVKNVAAGAHSTAIKQLLESMIVILDNQRADSSPVFVTCFSELGDDLNQWRAYGGVEGGYTIQFDSRRLRERGFETLPDGTSEPRTLLGRVEYDTQRQSIFFDDVIKWTMHFFCSLDGAKTASSNEVWREKYLAYWLGQLAILAPFIKHPSFRDEREWRLVHLLRPDFEGKLKFSQRQSMMRRHIALELNGDLPITGVRVGPSRHPNLSRIAVGDLLKQAGHEIAAMQIEVTEVPYRSS